MGDLAPLPDSVFETIDETDMPTYPTLRGGNGTVPTPHPRIDGGLFGTQAGFGRDLAQAEPLSLIDSVRETAAVAQAVRPFAEFIGEYPVLSFSLAMGTLLVGAALGGFIGASAQEVRK